MAKNMEEIARILKDTRFRRCIFGGVDEDEVWAQLERMNKEYTELLEARRQRAKGAVGSWREYALELEVKIREKDERLQLLTQMQDQPERPGAFQDARDRFFESTAAFEQNKAGRGCRARQYNQNGFVFSAEQIRKLYAGKGAGPVNRYYG